jgi:hypothetical protein
MTEPFEAPHETTGDSVRVLERARLNVTGNTLARAMARRLVGALAARSPLRVDRLEQACRIAEALVDGCAAIGVPQELTVLLGPAEITMRVGPLQRGDAAKLLVADRDGTIGALASDTSVRSGHSGETLLVVVR